MSDTDGRTIRVELVISSGEELSALRGALLAARGSELAEVRRRGGRLSYGYGSESARESMGSEVDRQQLRLAMLDRLIAAIDAAAGREGS